MCYISVDEQEKKETNKPYQIAYRQNCLKSSFFTCDICAHNKHSIDVYIIIFECVPEMILGMKIDYIIFANIVRALVCLFVHSFVCFRFVMLNASLFLH